MTPVGGRLADRAVHQSNQLSGGQPQRVAIARRSSNTVVSLADEPTGNRDTAPARGDGPLSALNLERGSTVLLHPRADMPNTPPW